MAFRAPILAFAIERRMPVITASRTFADPGVLLTYGASTAEGFRRAAGYIDKVLKGAKPADLPVEQPTKFELRHATQGDEPAEWPLRCCRRERSWSVYARTLDRPFGSGRFSDRATLDRFRRGRGPSMTAARLGQMLSRRTLLGFCAFWVASRSEARPRSRLGHTASQHPWSWARIYDGVGLRRIHGVVCGEEVGVVLRRGHGSLWLRHIRLRQLWTAGLRVLYHVSIGHVMVTRPSPASFNSPVTRHHRFQAAGRTAHPRRTRAAQLRRGIAPQLRPGAPIGVPWRHDSTKAREARPRRDLGLTGGRAN
jgi:hypothetical protein